MKTNIVLLILSCSMVSLLLLASCSPQRAPRMVSGMRYFEDIFRSGAENWNLEEGWHIERISDNAVFGNTVLEGIGPGRASLKNLGWSNYVFDSRFKLIKGTIQFDYRVSMPDGRYRYLVEVNRENSVCISKQKMSYMSSRRYHCG